MRCSQLSFSFTMALLFISMVLGPAIANQMPVGEITEIKGPVELVKDDGRQIRAEKGTPLFPGDQIITGKGGMVWFSFKQGDQYRLGEESQTSIDELSGPELEDNQPVLQLALGYLWSKIQKLRGQLHRTVVHTPTAVLGVRGTEFETVVSLDATSIVTVDDGTVEVEAEDEKTLVDRGKMTEVELDKKAITPVQAIPKDRRDWKRWRKRKIKRLFKHLPQKAPKFRERFEMRADRFSQFTARIRKTSARIDTTIKQIRQARRHRDRQKALESLVQLKVQAQKFKKMVAKFRKALNRVRVMGRLSHRLEKFASNNKERFSEQEFSVIDSNLAAVSEKRARLKTVTRNTVFSIKKTFKKLRKFREELRTIKPAANPHNPNRMTLRVDQGL
jgi:hypothetical protein